MTPTTDRSTPVTTTTEPRLHRDADGVTVWHGDCLDVLRQLPDASVHAVVTDPPYGIAFMGKAWDQPGEFGSERRDGSGPNHQRGAADAALEAGTYDLSPTAMRNFQRWVEAWAAECLRVLKPGGHLLAFGGSRTWHRLASGIEDAGFEVRDSIAWLHSQGMPKSLDVAKAVDRLDAAAERLERGREFQAWLAEHMTAQRVDELTGTSMGYHLTTHPTQPAVATAAIFDLLRPHLPVVPEHIEQLVAERSVESKAFAQRPPADYASGVGMAKSWTDGRGWNGKASRGGTAVTAEAAAWEGWGTNLKPAFEPIVVARKPFAGSVAANVVAHGVGGLNIGATRVGAEVRVNAAAANKPGGAALNMSAKGMPEDAEPTEVIGRWSPNVLLDDGQAAELESAAAGAAEYFPTFRYHPKAHAGERPRHITDAGAILHPTVKPLELMRWLVRLVTPAGGTVLEPFAGSGTTLEACVREGFAVIGIERESDYLHLIDARLAKDHQVTLFGEWEV